MKPFLALIVGIIIAAIIYHLREREALRVSTVALVRYLAIIILFTTAYMLLHWSYMDNACAIIRDAYETSQPTTTPIATLPPPPFSVDGGLSHRRTLYGDCGLLLEANDTWPIQLPPEAAIRADVAQMGGNTLDLSDYFSRGGIDSSFTVEFRPREGSRLMTVVCEQDAWTLGTQLPSTAVGTSTTLIEGRADEVWKFVQSHVRDHRARLGEHAGEGHNVSGWVVFDFFTFSTAALATLGDSVVAPSSRTARVLVSFQVLLGVIVTAFVLADSAATGAKRQAIAREGLKPEPPSTAD